MGIKETVERIVADTIDRFIVMKPRSESVDLGVALVSDLIGDQRIAELEAKLNELVMFQSSANRLAKAQAESINTIADLQAREKALVEYKNSVIDQFVTAHHSYDESISAYENISKLIAYHQDIALDPKVSSVAARWVTQIEELQAREKALVEALQNLVEDISKTHGNYTYEQAWINADEALANVRGE